jgi:general stress protein 26
MSKELIEKAEYLIQQNTVHSGPEGSSPYCVLALIDKDGVPTASTITPSKSHGIKWISFCTGFGSTKANRILNNSNASVCFNTGGTYNITLKGWIEVSTNPEMKQEMWYSGMGNHFSGPDDPGYCTLIFHTTNYNLWIDCQEAVGTLDNVQPNNSPAQAR